MSQEPQPTMPIPGTTNANAPPVSANVMRNRINKVAQKTRNWEYSEYTKGDANARTSTIGIGGDGKVADESVALRSVIKFSYAAPQFAVLSVCKFIYKFVLIFNTY